MTRKGGGCNLFDIRIDRECDTEKWNVGRIGNGSDLRRIASGQFINTIHLFLNRAMNTTEKKKQEKKKLAISRLIFFFASSTV